MYRFQQRHNLKFKTLHEESGSVNDAVCDEWIEEILHSILAEYRLCDIFSCDETSLLYRDMPKGTIEKKKKNEKLHKFEIKIA